MHMAVFRQSKENIDREKISTFKGPLLYSSLLNCCQKNIVNTKINWNQTKINEWTFYFLFFTFYLHPTRWCNNCGIVLAKKKTKKTHTDNRKSGSRLDEN